MSAGFGFISVTESSQFAFKVSENVDYEISFWFLQPTADASFELSCKCFSCDFSEEIRPIDVRNGAFNNVWLPGNQRVTSIANQWNFFHCILYKSNFAVTSGQPPTSHAQGTNLIMSPGTQKLFVNLTCVKHCLIMEDFKVKPADTPFSTGFIQSDGLTEIWAKNNKTDLSSAQVQRIYQKYLFPYNSASSVINI